MKLRLASALLLCCTLLLVFCACRQQDKKAPAPTTESTDSGQPRNAAEAIAQYDGYNEMSANEYSKRLQAIFLSLMPQCMDSEAYGLGNLSHSYGDIQVPPEELGQVTSGGGGIYWISESAIPAFYGLLHETETILSATGNLHEQDGTVLLYADEVEAAAKLLLRCDVAIRHCSAAGAEYDAAQRCYRYTKLEDPLAPYAEKGWELIYLGFEEEEDASLETNCTNPFWLEKSSGDLYSFSGELLCTKCQRQYLTGRLYPNYFLKLGLWKFGDNVVPLVQVEFHCKTDADGVSLPFDAETPVQIRLGTGSLTILDPEGYGELVEVELLEEGQ